MSRSFFNNILSRPGRDQDPGTEDGLPGAPAEDLPEQDHTQEMSTMSESTLFVDVIQEEAHNAFCVAFNAGGVTRDRLHELLGRIESEVEAIDPQAYLDIGIVETLRTRELRVTITGRDAGNALIGLGLVLRRMKEAGFEARWPAELDLTRLA
jgi:hypothetical protein